ncbi:ribonuclease H2 subunit B, putative [Plasmodium vinckei]|uniref:Ribonuclease H2 subunit B, putative n=1 Tax=Plasmodium vinckei TaxID=5860 RepID=A0A6V7SVK7_PLAVN|nr:ribonuclease H2 subunit B, putative [Plasmodium vinckei]
MDNENAFLFHIFAPNTHKNGNTHKNMIRNYSFIKLPSISEPSKPVLYHYNEQSNELYLLERNYYNPQIEAIKHEHDKINKSQISIFINNYAIENEYSFFCYPIDAIFIFISIIYKNYSNNTYITLEDLLDNVLGCDIDDPQKTNQVIKNTLYIFNKNVNEIKDRLKIICDELYENGKLFFKPNIQKIKKFYNFKCIMLYNYIVENKIVSPDYSQKMDKELLEKYHTSLKNEQILKIANEGDINEIDKYKEYTKHIDSYFVEHNNAYYKFNGQNLKTFIWLIIKGFMYSSLSEKLIPQDISDNLNKIKEETKKIKIQQNETFTKGKKHTLQTPRNQLMIDSFFKKKKVK